MTYLTSIPSIKHPLLLMMLLLANLSILPKEYKIIPNRFQTTIPNYLHKTFGQINPHARKPLSATHIIYTAPTTTASARTNCRNDIF